MAISLTLHTPDGDYYARFPAVPERGAYIRLEHRSGRVDRVEWVCHSVVGGLEDWRVEVWLVDWR